MTNCSLDQQIYRVEELVATLAKLGDPVARATSQELMHTLLNLHREGLSRLMEILKQWDKDSGLAAAISQDPLVSSLLLLHDLHPIDLKIRVEQALEQVRPLVRGNDSNLELIAIAGNRVRIRIVGHCSMSPEALEHLLEEAFMANAPDIEWIEVEDPARGAHAKLPLPLVAGFKQQ
jgi:Fe-S cluster biogenesis protein NfuA